MQTLVIRQVYVFDLRISVDCYVWEMCFHESEATLLAGNSMNSVTMLLTVNRASIQVIILLY